jgi:acetyltransferase-like isoleucine patch superfamily enzyme
MAGFEAVLDEARAILDAGLDLPGAQRLWTLLGGAPLPGDWLAEMKMEAEALPKVMEQPFTGEERLLHFFWEALDRLPAALMLPLSARLRRLLAERVFARCGKALLAEEGVRFNLGRCLEVGDNVWLRRGACLDTQGGLRLGNSVCIGEGARIVTHLRSESSYIERFYKPVVIEDFALVGDGAMILPGVVIGREAVVAPGAVVGASVPMNAVVAGNPATVVRQRSSGGRHGESLDHIWLY